MTVDDFQKLAAPDQEALLASVFEHRLKHAQNIDYESEHRIRNHVYHDGQIGDLRAADGRGEFRHWRLGDSYRMDIVWYGRPPGAVPVQHLSSSFNAADGVVRGTVRMPELPRVNARIGVEHDPVTTENRYQYWLDGKNEDPQSPYLVRYVADNKKDYTIDAPVDGDKVRLTIPWRPPLRGEMQGTREFLLDPRKGFLPIRGTGRWDLLAKGGRRAWRIEEFVVEESRLVKDVWMPIKLKEFIRASPLGPNKINVYETTILRIDSGNVRPKDLVVEFPEGTEVVDAIQGVNYRTDANGDPIGPVEGLVGARSRRPVPYVAVSKPSRLGPVLFALGGVVVLASIVMFFVRRMKLRGYTSHGLK